MSPFERREAPSAPKGYNIDSNSVIKEMYLMYEQARAIARGDYISGAFAGPPGIGKSFAAEKGVRDEGKKFILLRADANTFIEEMHRHRHRDKVCVWDDTNYVFNSTPTMNLLNHAILPQGVRRLVDKRPGGHGTFEIFNHHIFLTNKPLFDQELMAFDARQRTDIEAFRSRFHTQSEVGYLANHRDEAIEAIWHYACYVCTDGDHKLRDMRDGRNKALTREESNQVLRWWAENYHVLSDHSPRELQIIAEYRLKSPGIWEALAERRLLREPWRHPDGRLAQPIMEPWEIRASGKPSQHKVPSKPVEKPVEPVKPVETPKPKPVAKKPAKPVAKPVAKKPAKGKAA